MLHQYLCIGLARELTVIPILLFPPPLLIQGVNIDVVYSQHVDEVGESVRCLFVLVQLLVHCPQLLALLLHPLSGHADLLFQLVLLLTLHCTRQGCQERLKHIRDLAEKRTYQAGVAGLRGFLDEVLLHQIGVPVTITQRPIEVLLQEFIQRFYNTFQLLGQSALA